MATSALLLVERPGHRVLNRTAPAAQNRLAAGLGSTRSVLLKHQDIRQKNCSCTFLIPPQCCFATWCKNPK